MWNICRTCTTRQIGMISIFDQDKTPSIAAMITAISSLEILPGDRLPSEICITCFETLEMTYYFQQQVTRCNDSLLKQIQRTTLLAGSTTLTQQQANNEVAVKKEEEEFVSNEHMIVDSDAIATENITDHPSECHDPLMIDNDTYDSLKCDVSLNFQMPLTNEACDDLPEAIYIKGVNAHLEETECKPDVNEIDVEEYGVQFGDNGEINPGKMISNDVAAIDGFCSEDDLPITSVRESTGSCNVSRKIQDSSNENAEVTGEVPQGSMLEESYIKVVNSHLGESENKREINEIDIEEHGVQFGDNCETIPREMTFNNVEEVDEFCTDDDLLITSVPESTGSYNASQNVQNNSNENAEVTGEAFEGSLRDVGNLSTDKSIKCTYCDKLFNGNKSLQTHMYKHTNPHKCEICQKTYGAASHLKVHMRIHTGERPFKCQHCSWEFYTKSELKRHMLRHTGEKTIHCQQCNSKFYSKGNLKQHMRMHTGEAKPKPHRCEVCGDSFDAPYRLELHLRRHTGERTFNCQQCNSKFYTKGNLKQHMKTHTGEKTFHCDHCDSKFYAKSNLKNHMRRLHFTNLDKVRTHKRVTGPDS